MDLINNFKVYLNSNFFEVIENQKSIQLIEKKDEGYSVDLNIDRKESKFLVIQNLEELKKEYALYLTQHPKDCDYIILDLLKQEVYIIELKNTDTTSGEFMQQLESGEFWLDHLLFCCQMNGYTNDWKVKRVGIRYSAARPSKSRRPKKVDQKDSMPYPLKYIKDVNGKDMFLFRGEEFRIGQIIFV